MILDEAKSIALLIMAMFAVIILVRILMLVHHQSGRVKELELRMKAMESMGLDEASEQPVTETTDEDKEDE